MFLKKSSESWALVVHTCNPSYSEGRNQEDQDSSQDTISKKNHHKKNSGGRGSRCSPGVQTPVRQKKKKKIKWVIYSVFVFVTFCFLNVYLEKTNIG
jgi:hypothetical protein